MISAVLERFVSDFPNAVITEDGEPIFNLADGRYCVLDGSVLHLWSEEHNIVRRIVEIKTCAEDNIKLTAFRLGCSKRTSIEIHATNDWRCNLTQKLRRTKYRRLLEQILRREFSDWHIEILTTEKDLSCSFSDVYTRGLLRKGNLAFALLGTNQAEPQQNIDGALTAGILWLEAQRQRLNTTCVVQGLKLFLPRGLSQPASRLLAQLNPESAKWQVSDVDERNAMCVAAEADRDYTPSLHRVRPISEIGHFFGRSLCAIFDELPDAEIEVARYPKLGLSFAYRGFRFARAEIRSIAGTFENDEVLYFRIGAEEKRLTKDTEAEFRYVVKGIKRQRRHGGMVRDLYYRSNASDWLLDTVKNSIRDLDPTIDTKSIYTLSPTQGHFPLRCLLTRQHDGRLILVVVDCDEDITFPLKALECWCNLDRLKRANLLQKLLYFPNVTVADSQPILYCVCPVFRTHRSLGVVLKHFGKHIEWKVLQVNEHWRRELRIVERRSNRCLAEEFFEPPIYKSKQKQPVHVLAGRGGCYHALA